MLRFVTCFFCINSDDRDDRVLRPSVLLVRCVPLAAFPVLNHPPLLEYIPLGHGASPFKMLLIQCASFFFFFLRTFTLMLIRDVILLFSCHVLF